MFHKFDPVREAVTRGADWLDATYPEWLDKVNVETLDIESCTSCVLGQLFGVEGYAGYNRIIDFLAKERNTYIEFIYDQAFCGRYPQATYQEMNNTWRDEILSRRALQAAL